MDKQDIYQRLFSLSHPLLTTEIVDFLLEEHELEYFLSQIAVESEERRGWKIGYLLQQTTDDATRLYQLGSQRMMHSIVNLMESAPQSSHIHIRKIYMLITNRCPDILEIVFSEEPLVLRIMQHLTIPEYADCLVAPFVRLYQSGIKELQDTVFERLLIQEFFPQLFSILLEESKMHDATESMSRLVRSCADMESSHIMYQGLGPTVQQLVQKFVNGPLQYQIDCLDLFHTIFYTRYANSFQEPKQSLAKALVPFSEQLMQPEFIGSFPLSTQTKLFDIFTGLVVHFEGHVVDKLDWIQYLEHFFTKSRNANIFHASFLRLFKACVRHSKSFTTKMDTLGFFDKLDEYKNTTDDSRAFVHYLLDWKKRGFENDERGPVKPAHLVKKTDTQIGWNESMPEETTNLMI